MRVASTLKYEGNLDLQICFSSSIVAAAWPVTCLKMAKRVRTVINSRYADIPIFRQSGK